MGQDTAQAHAPRAAKGTGRNGLQPQGRTHWGDLADPSGQWQEQYSKAAGLSPARLHRGPWQTWRRAMGATDDRRAGTQPREGSPAKQRGPATGATGVRRSYHRMRRIAAAIPPVVRDTPYGWAASRAACPQEAACDPGQEHVSGHPSTGTAGRGGGSTAFPSTCGSGLRGT